MPRTTCPGSGCDDPTEAIAYGSVPTVAPSVEIRSLFMSCDAETEPVMTACLMAFVNGLGLFRSEGTMSCLQTGH